MTTTAPFKRDYSLDGESTRRALESGLANADWYRSEVDRKILKDLMRRSDAVALRDSVLWIVLILASAAGGIWFWGSWWCVPFFFVYGVLYGSSSDARWHECGHGTAFRTRWMSEVIYQIASFMLMRNPTTWRWSHARHHTDTIIVGRDNEIGVMRPPAMIRIVLDFIGVFEAWHSMQALGRNAAGQLSVAEKSFIPEREWSKAILAGRIHIAIYAATLAASLHLWSWLPLMLIGLPRLYGCWHMHMTGLLQHGGLAENVIDHRLNTRTVYMNPVSRYVYWNMNYHIEHHMYPMVPFHALPRLHALIKDDLPAASPSILHGLREVFGILMKQRRDVEYYLRRPLPPTARPYRDPPNGGDVPAVAERGS